MNTRFSEIDAIDSAFKVPTAQPLGEFLEKYMSNYSGSDYIGWMEDICCYFYEHGADPDRDEGLLADYGSEDEMISEYKRMAEICYEEAMYNFIHS